MRVPGRRLGGRPRHQRLLPGAPRSQAEGGGLGAPRGATETQWSGGREEGGRDTGLGELRAASPKAEPRDSGWCVWEGKSGTIT